MCVVSAANAEQAKNKALAQIFVFILLMNSPQLSYGFGIVDVGGHTLMAKGMVRKKETKKPKKKKEK